MRSKGQTGGGSDVMGNHSDVIGNHGLVQFYGFDDTGRRFDLIKFFLLTTAFYLTGSFIRHRPSPLHLWQT